MERNRTFRVALRAAVFLGGLAPIAMTACHHHSGAHVGDGGVGDIGEAPDMTVVTFSDFPADPQIDPGLPADVGTQITATGAPSGGATEPCLVEPSMGALFPKNWTPLYFEWTSASNDNLYELRLHIANQVNDLVVYTSGTSYTLNAGVWGSLASHSSDLDIQVSLRSAKLTGTTVSAPGPAITGSVRIAPVEAPGNIVYWTTSNSTALKGYIIGSTSVSTVITPTAMNDGTTCVGCHTSSPDGKYSFLTRQDTKDYSVDVRTVDGTSTKAPAVDVSDNAFANFARKNQTLPVLSGAHYSASDAVAISVLAGTDTSGNYELVWTDLHATSGGTGIIARTGDPREAASPSFSHDGTKIAYTSSTQVGDGRTLMADTDLFIVPYNDHNGGAATPVAGASASGDHEYYPVFSPDDELLAFSESPASAQTYDEPKAEVRVIPATGGTATRLLANDPPACTGKVSPGITNSWPRWSPEIETAADGKRYHWLVFSSRRRGDGTHPQLYVTGVVVDSAGVITSYPAIYITAQPQDESNHTPAWDVFQLPPVL